MGLIGPLRGRKPYKKYKVQVLPIRTISIEPMILDVWSIDHAGACREGLVKGKKQAAENNIFRNPGEDLTFSVKVI